MERRHSWARFGAICLALAVGNLALIFLLSQRGRLAAVAVAAQNDQVRQGAGLFATYCSVCHGNRGEGTAQAPRLNDPGFLAGVSDDLLRDTIAQGRPGTAMLAWSQAYGGTLTAEQIEKLVAFVRSWERPGAAVGIVTTLSGRPADSVEGGQETFLLMCSGCHGDDGGVPVGTKQIVANAPERLRQQTDADLRQRILNGGTEMPGFGAALSPAQVDGLIKYLQSWPR